MLLLIRNQQEDEIKSLISNICQHWVKAPISKAIQAECVIRRIS